MAKDNKKQAHFRRGLSHFEMMIVLSVIIIIMAMLIPVLRRAKKDGEKTHCLGNERQLMTAWYNYTIDNDDKLCNPDRYISSLLHYTHSQDVFYCVSFKRPWTVMSTGTYTGTNPIDAPNSVVQSSSSLPNNVYDPNSTLITNDDGLENYACYAVSNTMGGIFRDGIRPFRKYQRIKQPSTHMVIIDIEPPAGPTFWPIVLSDGDWQWRPRSWPAGLQGLTDRHSKGCNYAFADGHCQYYPWSDKTTLDFISTSNQGSSNWYPLSNSQQGDLGRMVKMLGRD